MRIEEELEEPLTIEKKVFQGYGLSDWQGRKVFIAGGVPGDIAEVKLTHRKKDVYFGEITSLLKESGSRREAGCEAFGGCGGCDWLNINRQAQLEYKEAIIDDFFYNLEVASRLPIGFSEQEYHYRNKCFYPLRIKNGKPVFGMYARFSHNLITHQQCLLQPELFDLIAENICHYLESGRVEIYDEKTGNGNARYIGFRSNGKQDQVQVILVTRKRRLPFSKQLVRLLSEKYPEVVSVIQNINSQRGNVILGDDEKVLYGGENLEMEVAGKTFTVSYKAFFQVNTAVLEKMIDFCGNIPDSGGCLVDVYCGTGVLGICLSASFARVTGIDNSQAAIENARINAKLNGADNCKFCCGDATELIKEVLQTETEVSLIFDPPRKGLTPEIIECVSASNIRRIIYISCNPATQVRDLKKLVEAGYMIWAVQAFDMFPQTWHIENAVIMEKR